ncbi:Protein-methionine sulfoxide oxidase [Actinidia chinensis var. chinensis]|uniref:Protein-methionine sulfoxide oxidase n=1 Tax=Actinidia chinensis var. chinensis TaxID=1590841 RepID=A0A2R6PM51_ACTCC|nr:Protein-methionine sulfoxide oxidase [Actinidia chinensis var. chinensis]
MLLWSFAEADFIFRAGIMYMSNDGKLGQQMRSNMFSLTGTGCFGAIGRSFNLGGQTALALHLLLAVFSSKISSDLNRPFGDELERAWNSLQWNEKLSLVLSVVRGVTSSADISRNSLKESSIDDSSFQLYELLSSSFPSLLQPLTHERDTYFVWSLKRSKAVNNSKRVVGVIGKGHLNGVIYMLISDQGNFLFKDLVGKRLVMAILGSMPFSRTWLETLSLASCCGHYLNN